MNSALALFMERYWVYLDSKVHGPVDVPGLRKLPGFNLLSQVCPENGKNWRMADDIVEIKSYFLAPPRAITAMPVWDVIKAAPGTAPAAAPELVETLPSEKGPPTIEVLVPPGGVVGRATPGGPSSLPPGFPAPMMGTPPAAGDAVVEELAPEAASGGSLRVSCINCGYKNPRDIPVCMKCGTPLKKGVPTAAKPPVVDPLAAVTQAMGLDAPTATPAAATPTETIPDAAALTETPTLPPGTSVELSPTRIMMIAGVLLGVGTVAFVGNRLHAHRPVWPFHARAKAKPEAKLPPPAVASAPAPAPVSKKRRSNTSRHSSAAAAGALPGMESKTEAQESTANSEAPPPPSRSSRSSRRSAAAADLSASEPASNDSSTEQPASYQILNEAAPVKHRDHASLDSPYAKKRRSDKALWTEQQKQAIQQVQRFRIYGAQRTIERNVEILMQILRDREYDTAFQTGRRIYLYDDVDWDASQVDGPSYEVRLTFSGGKETDGTARKALKVAFVTDLERGTVEGGGQDQVRANTLHAFFDESRIPPEDRRDIARDTEELVQAAQPDGSPLALDTVARHFSATYGLEATKRVARAYNLSLLDRKIVHEPKIARADVNPNPDAPLPSSVERKPQKGAAAAAAAAAFTANETTSRSAEKTMNTAASNSAAATPGKMVRSKSGPVEYQMESGSGRQRIVSARAESKASPSHLFEVTTSYERLKQFVPDLLTSEREGEDGSAVIVHIVGLTRIMFFVFKVNLHLRVIEHPQQHTLEFERIAGEFEQFRGAMEIQQQTPSGPAIMHLHATIVPKGHMPDWVLRKMAERFLVPVVDSIRSRAESIS